MYNPNPINTNDVTLPPEIEALAERLAENTHEVWAAGRIREGWTYGAERNDVLRTHPCLVPYDQLTEVEKEYDRATALETLKVILQLGFTISKDNYTAF